jgi:aquaporin Z
VLAATHHFPECALPEDIMTTIEATPPAAIHSRVTDPRSLDRRLATEFLGTFVLVFTVAMATSGDGAGALAPLAIGSALMVMVFAGAHISGAHYNPAVSLAMAMRREITAAEAGTYAATQLISGALAGLLATALVGSDQPFVVASTWKILVVESVFTFALAYVILNAATARETIGNSFFGLAIGFTVATGAFAVGKVSGGIFNPAVALGATLAGALTWSHLWVYVTAGAIGGISAAGVFTYLHPGQWPNAAA